MTREPATRHPPRNNHNAGIGFLDLRELVQLASVKTIGRSPIEQTRVGFGGLPAPTGGHHSIELLSKPGHDQQDHTGRYDESINDKDHRTGVLQEPEQSPDRRQTR